MALVLRAQFQMLILALHLVLHITPYFNRVKVLVPELILQYLLKVTTPLDVMFNV